jgi:hypothetical protein
MSRIATFVLVVACAACGSPGTSSGAKNNRPSASVAPNASTAPLDSVRASQVSAERTPARPRPAIVGHVPSPQLLVVDEANVYVLSHDLAARIAALPKSGGSPVALLPGGGASSNTPWEALAQSEDRVFFSGTVSIEQPSLRWIVMPTIVSVAKRGGAPRPFQPSLSRRKNIAVRGIAIDARWVYWLEGIVGDFAPRIDGERLVRASRDGGPATALATGLQGATELAVDDVAAYVVVVSNAGGARGGRILRVPLAGGGATTIVSSDVEPAALRVDADRVYWVAGDRLLAIDKSSKGGAPSVVVVGFDAVETEVRKCYTLDDAFVYWATSTAVLRQRKDGSTTREILDAHTDATAGALGAIAIDETHIYYAIGDAILKLAK